MIGRRHPALANSRRWHLCPVAVAVLLALAAAAHACNVPVFRYALEHWDGDAYRLVIFHQGKLTDAEQSLLKGLQADGDRPSANIAVRTVDINNIEEDADRKLVESEAKSPMPRMMLQYPKYLKMEAPVWSAPLNTESIAQLTDSPARKELIRRLIDGQTAVWILLESGQREKDDDAAKRLETELKKLQQTLKLPELTDAPEDSLREGPPLRVDFSLLRVSRSVEEEALVAMLLHAESDLAEESEPLIFPVFGRGRALLPRLGAGITAENIQSSAEFLVGPCSCQVKELNPGFDLLLTANWGFPTTTQVAEGFDAAADREAPAVAELVPIPGGATGAASQPSPQPSASTANSKAETRFRFVIVGGALTAIAVVATAWLLRKQSAARTYRTEGQR